MDTITSSMIEAGRAAYRARLAARIAARAEMNARNTRADSCQNWQAEAAAACRKRAIKSARRAAHQAQRLQEGLWS